MQDPGHNRVDVCFDLGQNKGCMEAMLDKRGSCASFLFSMGSVRKIISLLK